MRDVPTPDLQRRLLGNGGPIPGQRGLWPENRKPREAPPGAELPAWLDPLAIAIAERLRDAPNLNVRPPSHIAAPFRAVPFVWTNVPGAAETVVDFGGNTQVPEGCNAVIHTVKAVYIFPTDSGANFPITPIIDPTQPTYYGWSLLRNGIPMPGFFNRTIGLEVGNIAPLGTGDATTLTRVVVPQVAPPTLRAGDVLTFAITNGALDWFVQVAGYLYYLENDGDGIAGTVVDRG